MNCLTRILPPVVVMALGISALLSMACGIIAAPIELPRLLFVDSRIKAQIDIVGPDHQPLTDVDVALLKTCEAWDWFFAAVTKEKPEQFHTDQTHPLTIDRYGYYEISATISKKGYRPAMVVFQRGPFNYTQDGRTLIDVNATPRVQIMLLPETETRP